jgi:hypothetical protein
MRTLADRLALALAVTAFSLAGEVRAQAPQTPSALERSPDGWKDLIAKGDAGPGASGIEGWSSWKIPPGPRPTAAPKPANSISPQWKYDAAVGGIACAGDGGHEWLRWDEELGDFVFHAEWRFTPAPGKKGYNSGIYVRNSADASIWHQAQTGDASGGYLFGDTPVDGKVKRVNLAGRISDKRVKPAGEWNVYEITCKGKEISLWVNGATTCVFDACEVPRGYVGLEAEGYRIQFRNLKVKPLGGP